MTTKIALACDDVGFERKEEIQQYLISRKDAEIIYDPVKTPEDGKNTFARLADEMCELIQRDVCRLGVYICGTGIGFTCQANKHWGIRAVMVSNPYTAQRARLSNNAQIIGMGARVLGSTLGTTNPSTLLRRGRTPSSTCWRRKQVTTATWQSLTTWHGTWALSPTKHREVQEWNSSRSSSTTWEISSSSP